MKNTPILPTAIYTRPDLRLILGRNLGDRVCARSRRVARGRYLGRHVLEALESLGSENEYGTTCLVTPSRSQRKRERSDYSETNRKDWTC